MSQQINPDTLLAAAELFEEKVFSLKCLVAEQEKVVEGMDWNEDLDAFHYLKSYQSQLSRYELALKNVREIIK